VRATTVERWRPAVGEVCMRLQSCNSRTQPYSALGGVWPVQQPPPMQFLAAAFRLRTEGLTYFILSHLPLFGGQRHSAIGGVLPVEQVWPVQQAPPMQLLAACFRLTTEGLA